MQPRTYHDHGSYTLFAFQDNDQDSLSVDDDVRLISPIPSNPWLGKSDHGRRFDTVCVEYAYVDGQRDGDRGRDVTGDNSDVQVCGRIAFLHRVQELEDRRTVARGVKGGTATV